MCVRVHKGVHQRAAVVWPTVIEIIRFCWSGLCAHSRTVMEELSHSFPLSLSLEYLAKRRRTTKKKNKKKKKKGGKN